MAWCDTAPRGRGLMPLGTHQLKNHRKGGLLVGGGGGNRLVSRGSRYIARPLGQRQAMLDETLSSPRVDAG